MRDLFAEDAGRAARFSIELDALLFDYAKHITSDETLGLLIGLAETSGLEDMREAMFAGEHLNQSENRAVLHPALRGSVDEALEINGEPIGDYVISTQKRIEQISSAIRAAKNITDVVNIGIGGSVIGPQMVCEALQSYADGPTIHFISNIDGAPLARLLDRLKPQNTVFVITSKTFTTLETMANAAVAKDWIIGGVGIADAANHFVGITEDVQAAKDFGIVDDHILAMREWIGGRYSLWSGVGLPIAIACGFDHFKALLDGAQAVDEHFKTAPLDKNIPVIMGLLGIWYRNFFDYGAHAILPYAQDLKALPAYVQQLDMESNGKSVSRDGQAVNHKTSPVVFGGTGTGAQHAFFQCLHQGTDVIPADFIAIINADHKLTSHHNSLLGMALAQAQALMEGNGDGQAPYRQFPGNRPSSMILLDRLDARCLGMALALYEHKSFVQGCIWNINSFDQWGVELGKKLAVKITAAIKGGADLPKADGSTRKLLAHIKKRTK